MSQVTTQVVERKENPLEKLIMTYQQDAIKHLPQFVNPERFMSMMTTVAKANLAGCTERSIIVAMLDCASLGLDPNPMLGQAYFVPFERSVKKGQQWEKVKECQLIPGYRGFISLAQRSGMVSNIQASVVYENDLFDYELGLEPRLKHKPEMNGERGERKAAYAICTFKDGSQSFWVSTRDEIEKAKKSSKSAGSEYSPWNKEESVDWMWIKTAVRRLAKFMPLSPELIRAVSIDEADEHPRRTRINEYNLDRLPEAEIETEQDISLQGWTEKILDCQTTHALSILKAQIPKAFHKDLKDTIGAKEAELKEAANA